MQRLDQNEINSVVDALQASGAIVENAQWLAKGEACDIFFAVLPQDEARQLLEHLLANVPFDACVQPNRNRRKRLLVCDMDSTIIAQECIDELADFLGLKDKVAAITKRAMNGELDFPSALRERVALLKNMEMETLEKTYRERITLMPGAQALVRTMRENGARCVLVSGGFTFFTRRVKEAVGFDAEEANILEIENNKLTGRVREPILDKTAKLNALKFHSEELGLTPYESMAVGDGANDLPMLLHAGLGVAYHAHPNVRTQARVRIDTCDLSSLLYVQGYTAEQVVT